jgi:hypothetical protein
MAYSLSNRSVYTFGEARDAAAKRVLFCVWASRIRKPGAARLDNRGEFFQNPL